MNLTKEENNVIESIKKGFLAYKGENVLKGPSKYFHDQALIYCRNDFLGERHIEMVYATLVSWGMNNRGAKMPEYDIFKNSIIECRNKPILYKWRSKHIEQLTRDEFTDLLKDLDYLIFDRNGLKGSDSYNNNRIVSASKMLAHIMPNLIPPIDNTYTLAFFKRYIPRCGWKTLHRAVFRVMYNLYQDNDNLAQALALISRYDLEYVTLPKLFDNVIITEEIKRRKKIEQ